MLFQIQNGLIHINNLVFLADVLPKQAAVTDGEIDSEALSTIQEEIGE